MNAYALVLGEALVDLIEDHDAEGSMILRPRYGGSPFNVAVGLRRLGAGVEFVGAFGDDAFGRQLKQFLGSEGVEVRHSCDAGMGTCLSLATTREGHVHYEYFGDQASMYQIACVDPAVAVSAAVVHAGSTVFNSDPAYSTALDLYAATQGFTTMDPNPRPFLIADVEEHRTRLERAAGMVDLVKVSGEDVAYLYPDAQIATAARHIRGAGNATVIITRAHDDTLLAHGDETTFVPVASTTAIDPTGAGDSFMASIVADVLAHGRPAHTDAWRTMVMRANTAAAITCSAVGGAESMPTRDQLNDRLGDTGAGDGGATAEPDVIASEAT